MSATTGELVVVTKTAHPVYTLVLEAMPDPAAKVDPQYDRDADYRLKLLLKHALRTWGFRCRTAANTPDDHPLLQQEPTVSKKPLDAAGVFAPFVTDAAGRKYVVAESIGCHFWKASWDGLGLVTFDSDDTLYLRLEDAIRWAEGELRCGPDELLALALPKLKAFAAGEIAAG